MAFRKKKYMFLLLKDKFELSLPEM